MAGAEGIGPYPLEQGDILYIIYLIKSPSIYRSILMLSKAPEVHGLSVQADPAVLDGNLPEAEALRIAVCAAVLRLEGSLQLVKIGMLRIPEKHLTEMSGSL